MNFDTEKKFLYVKEKLDGMRLPTVFPAECVPLLYSLMNLIPSSESSQPIANNKYSQGSTDDSTKVVHTFMQVRAVTHEMQKAIKENNTLHLEVIHLK
jgi:hypothetical protein